MALHRDIWILHWLLGGFPAADEDPVPDVDPLQYAFLGPLVGALSRAATGWIADKYGGGRVTFWTFLLMIPVVGGVLVFIATDAFWGFFAMFMALFFLTGIGNASTFQMIPQIMGKEMDRLMPHLDMAGRTRQAEKESAAIIGFTSAIAAYGAFIIPRAYGTSIDLTGGPEAALWLFMAFYVSCAAITYIFYTRRGGHLYDIEHGTAAQPSEAKP